MLFKINDKSVVKSADLLKEVPFMIYWFIYLIILWTQLDFFKAITVLKKIISNMKTDITDQSEEQRKKVFVKKENILSNAEMLFKKRGELLVQVIKNNIISRNEKFYYGPKKSEESISEKSE